MRRGEPKRRRKPWRQSSDQLAALYPHWNDFLKVRAELDPKGRMLTPYMKGLLGIWLQAMILTDGPRMVRTPTYWVYDLYKPWQDAVVIPLDVDTPWYDKDEFVLPAVSASAERAKDGRLRLALANADPERSATVAVTLAGASASAVDGQIITAPEMNAHNTFDHPDALRPAPFAGAQVRGDTLTVELPAKSVVVLRLQ